MNRENRYFSIGRKWILNLHVRATGDSNDRSEKFTVGSSAISKNLGDMALSIFFFRFLGILLGQLEYETK